MGDISRSSDEEKRLKGQSRYIKNTPQTKPITNLWPAPDDLGDRARVFYSTVGNILVDASVLTELDRFSFEELAYQYGQLIELRVILRRDGYVIGEAKNGHVQGGLFGESNGNAASVKRHPAANLAKETFNNFMRLAERFGLTPADRRKIDLPTDTNPKDQVRDFLGL